MTNIFAIFFTYFCLIFQIISLSKKFYGQNLKVTKLREILNSGKLTLMPCCYDGLTARLVEDSGFPLTFMTGFGVSASFGQPDLGLLAGADMFQAASTICDVLQKIPCIGDGDTG